MKLWRKALFPLLAALAMSVAMQASASVRVDFACTVTSANAALGIAAGTPLSGYFVYDDTGTDSDPDPTAGRYSNTVLAAGVTVGGYTGALDIGGTSNFTYFFDNFVPGGGARDQVDLSAPLTSNTVGGYQLTSQLLSLYDSTAAVFNDDSIQTAYSFGDFDGAIGTVTGLNKIQLSFSNGSSSTGVQCSPTSVSDPAPPTHTVTIDPAAYAGDFYLLDAPYGRGWENGVQTYDLPAGVYSVGIGAAGGQSLKAFEVMSDGNVSPASANDSSASFEFVGSTVRFRNATVDFDPRLFVGPIWVQHVTTSTFAIPDSLVLVPDNDYSIRLQDSFTNAFIHVDDNGLVGPATPQSANTNFISGDLSFDFDNAASPNPTVRLKNTTVRFDPQSYSGHWLISYQTNGIVQGVHDLVLIPAFNFGVRLSSLNAAGVIWFQVNADGSLGVVPTYDASDQAVFDNTATVPTLQFRNTTVHFKPGRFAGGYRMDFNQPTPGQYLYGPQTLVLVPATRYALQTAAETWVAYALDASGAFGPWTCCHTDPAFMDRSDSLIFDGDTLRFRNTDIRIAPSDGSTWRSENAVTAQSGTTGTHILSVIPAMQYGIRDFDATATGFFEVLAPCAIDPAGGIPVGNTFYEIACVPHANAGVDQTVDEETLVALDGTASEFPAGASPGYSWTQIAGPAVALDSASAAQPGFTSPSISAQDGSQTLTFSLVVDDGSNESAPDTVDVTVLHVNKAPFADAGDDVAVREGSIATLDGNHSYDPDGDAIAGYLWSQTAGTAVVLQPDNATATPQFQAPLADGTPLLFQLAVSDGSLTSVASAGTSSAEADTVQVTVGANTAPVANAGPDQTRDEGVSVTLDGSASSDSDGDGISYEWAQTGGTSVTLDDPTLATPTFAAPAVNGGGETLTFSLVVTDDYGFNPKSSAADTVEVHVQNVNDPPSCDLAVASPDRLWPPNHKMVGIRISGVTDPNAGDTLTIHITGVQQDEPIDGLGDGDTAPDAIVQTGPDGNDTVLLRAERAGDGNGRVYHIGFSASDGDGSCSGSLVVDVPPSRKAGAVDDGGSYSSVGI